MNSRRLHLFPLVLLTIVIAAVLVTMQPVNAQGKECIQIIVGGGIVEYVVTVDAQTYTPVNDPQLTIPPTAYFSPDRKYAVFWQVKDDALGFYISSTQVKSPLLLQKTRLDSVKNRSNLDYTDIDDNHFRRELQDWSPDSSKFAYIDKDKGQYFIIIVNDDGTNKQSKPVMSPLLKHPIRSVDILGWSADSKYIAAYVDFDPETKDSFSAEHIEFHVWTADLEEIKTDIVPDTDFIGGGIIATWAPTGHRLAVQLFSVPELREYDNFYGTKLAIWSPEHGIEADNFAQARDVFRDTYHAIDWSPDETHLRVWMGWDHASIDMVFGIDGKRIVSNKEQIERFNPKTFDHTTDFIGWTANGFALMLDTNRLYTKNETSEYKETTELYLVNVNKGSRILLERDALVPRMSYDGNYVAFKDNNETVKLIDLRTFRETPFKRVPIGMSATLRQWGTSLWFPSNQYVAFGNFNHYEAGFTDFIVNAETLERINIQGEYTHWLNDEWIIFRRTVRNNEYHLEVRNIKSKIAYDLGKTTYGVNESAIISFSVSPDQRYVAILLDKETLTVLSLEDGKQVKRATAVNFWQTPNFLHGAYTTHDLTQYRLTNYDLAWSPDSRKLAFVEVLEKQTNLVVLDQTGKEEQKVALPDTIPHDFSGYVTWTNCD